MPYCHQGIVFRRKILYNLNFKIASDFDRVRKDFCDTELGEGYSIVMMEFLAKTLLLYLKVYLFQEIIFTL